VSGVGALMVAGMIPTIYTALKLDAAYQVYKNKIKEEDLSYVERTKIGYNALCEAKLNWFNYLRRIQDDPPSVRVKNALISYIEKWYNKEHGTITFYITQLITGHGCFREFLYKIKKVDSPTCEFCTVGQDSAQHTLECCNRWNRERLILTDGIGHNLDLNSVMGKILESKENWMIFSRFCTEVLRKKEKARREEERERRRHLAS